MSAPTRIDVTALESSGFTLFADVLLRFDTLEHLTVRGIRAYVNRSGFWVMEMPHVRRPDRSFTYAVAFPKAWRPAIVAAIRDRAIAEGLALADVA